jgi:hypothetical protein
MSVISTSIRCFVVTVALGGSIVCVARSLAGTPPVDNSHDTVSCTTISKGVIKPKPALNGSGGVPTVMAISGTLAGCTSNDASITLPEGKSKFKGTLTTTTNNCHVFIVPVGAPPVIGTMTITWGTAPAVTNKTTTITISPPASVVGRLLTFAGTPYEELRIGSPFMEAPVSATGGFTGTDGGASSGLDMLIQESLFAMDSDFCDTIRGLTRLTIGVGRLIVG